MNDEPEPPSDADIVNTHLNGLSEHFDSVQILATRLEPDGRTVATILGSGNWYARTGLARFFLDQDQATTQDAIFVESEEQRGDDLSEL